MGNDNFLPKLDFFGRTIEHDNSCNDVRIKKYTNTREDGFTVGLTIKKDIIDLISNTGYIEFAILKNRLFFRQANKKDGLKVLDVPQSKSTVRVTVGSQKFAEKVLFFEGEYELKYDKFYDLYYIEKEN